MDERRDERVSRVSLTTDLTHTWTRVSRLAKPNPALKM